MNSLEINCETGEEILTTLTAKQVSEVEAREAALLADQAKREQDVISKSALLEKLGISEDEAKLLLG
jgi:hypothetical protein